MIIRISILKGIVLNKITRVKYFENYLIYVNYLINVNYDYIIKKENQDRILNEFFQNKLFYKLKFKLYS